MSAVSDPCTPYRLDRSDPRFPQRLLRTPDPPRHLWACGDHDLSSRPAIAVIGSRKATPYGLTCARRFARWAVSRGVVVVSGAAIGCDLAAHEGALEAEGLTIAVLGCGPDVDYPRRGARVLQQVREVGLICSECPPGTPPRRWAFPRRNRLIAGLADAVLVVEAGLPSGTFSTADHALEAGREVLAVPGSIHSPTSRGTNRLIRQGAAPVTSEEDLDDLLGILAPTVGATTSTSTDQSVSASDTRCDPLVTALTADPMRPQEAAASCGIPAHTILARLGRLESEGVVCRYPDGRYGVPPGLTEGD